MTDTTKERLPVAWVLLNHQGVAQIESVDDSEWSEHEHPPLSVVQPSRSRLKELAKKLRPPQRWYDEQP